jgi:CRP-like cAMP-binding protein
MNDLDTLKMMPLFSEVSDIAGYISNRGICFQRYNKGVTVYNHSESCASLDVVLSGNLIAYFLAENGSATTVFEFGPGSILGANLLFAEINKYPLNIYCLSDCALAHIDKAAVKELLHNYGFVMEYIKSLSRNSQGLNQKIAMYSQKTLRDNLIDYLKVQSEVQNSNVIFLQSSKKELADYFGVQRPSLFRELKRMKEEGIIEIKNRTIIILHQIK